MPYMRVKGLAWHERGNLVLASEESAALSPAPVFLGAVELLIIVDVVILPFLLVRAV